jgi:hypothetical protein
MHRPPRTKLRVRSVGLDIIGSMGRDFWVIGEEVLGAGLTAYVDLKQAYPHAIICGSTGTGKGRLIRSGLAHHGEYGDIQIVFTPMPKEYRPFARTGACSIAYSPPTITRAIRWTELAMDRRIAEVDAHEEAEGEEGIESYMDLPGVRRRIILWMDEISNLLGLYSPYPNELIAEWASRLGRILNMGRKAGIHVRMAPQQLTLPNLCRLDKLNSGLKSAAQMRICLGNQEDNLAQALGDYAPRAGSAMLQHLGDVRGRALLFGTDFAHYSRPSVCQVMDLSWTGVLTLLNDYSGPEPLNLESDEIFEPFMDQDEPEEPEDELADFPRLKGVA